MWVWILTDLVRERGKLVDMLTRVLTAGYAEPKLKVEALEQLLTEVMPLDHAEVIDGLLPDRELYPAAREQGKDFYHVEHTQKNSSVAPNWNTATA